MPIAHTIRSYRAQLSSADESERCGRATFTVRHLSETRLLITAIGELDATNARAFGRFVERHTGVSKQLVLDLSDLDFFGSEGFASLHYVSVHCARHDVDWLFIGGRIVQRIVAICDPDAELPLADDLGAALARLDHLGRCRHPVQSAATAKPTPVLRSPQRRARPSPETSNERAM